MSLLVDEEDRKLFVENLHPFTTPDDLSKHFTSFGEIEKIDIKTHPVNGTSRGFGFILYKTVQSLNSAIEAKERMVHMVKHRRVDVRKAEAMHGKLRVANLNSEITPNDIREHFAQYGVITNIEQPWDKKKNTRSPICFITFENIIEKLRQLAQLGTTTIRGIKLDVKLIKDENHVTVKNSYAGLDQLRPFSQREMTETVEVQQSQGMFTQQYSCIAVRSILLITYLTNFARKILITVCRF